MTLNLVDRSILALCALQEVNQELEELEVPGESGFLPGLHQTTSELYTAEMVDITHYRVKTAVLTRYRLSDSSFSSQSSEHHNFQTVRARDLKNVHRYI